jgi:hypothetical protein
MNPTILHTISLIISTLAGVIAAVAASGVKNFVRKHTRRNIELRAGGKATEISLPPDAKNSDVAEAVRKAFLDSREARP